MGVQPQPGLKSQQQHGSSTSSNSAGGGSSASGGQSSTDQLVQLGGDKPAEKERNPTENLGYVQWWYHRLVCVYCVAYIVYC